MACVQGRYRLPSCFLPWGYTAPYLSQLVCQPTAPGEPRCNLHASRTVWLCHVSGLSCKPNHGEPPDWLLCRAKSFEELSSARSAIGTMGISQIELRVSRHQRCSRRSAEEALHRAGGSFAPGGEFLICINQTQVGAASDARRWAFPRGGWCLDTWVGSWRRRGCVPYFPPLERLGDLDWELLLVGGGPLEDELRQRASGMDKAGDRIRFVGYVPHVEAPNWLSLFDVMVLPSETRSNWMEQFGRVLVEAMALRHSGFGFQIPARSPRSFAQPEEVSCFMRAR